MTRYEQGFLTKCAEYGLDAGTAMGLLEKRAGLIPDLVGLAQLASAAGALHGHLNRDKTKSGKNEGWTSRNRGALLGTALVPLLGTVIGNHYDKKRKCRELMNQVKE